MAPGHSGRPPASAECFLSALLGNWRICSTVEETKQRCNKSGKLIGLQAEPVCFSLEGGGVWQSQRSAGGGM
ncbi:hypothetical protein SRHO_G00021940 [Serrasalmus rhombeus]